MRTADALRPSDLRLAAIAAVLAAAAIGGCADSAGPQWSVELGPLKPILLSVWGRSSTDVWTVGGSPGVTIVHDMAGSQDLAAPPDLAVAPDPDAALAEVRHYDGSTWTPVDAPFPAVLWWVFGFSPTDVWMAGEYGTVLHWDGSRFERRTSGVEDPRRNFKLFGIWGAAPDDVYVVGGNVDSASTVLHYDGHTLAALAGAPSLGGAWYKVWGSAANDVYLVGEFGNAAHFDGAAWSKVDLSGAGVTQQDQLLTVAGSGKNDVYIVGGLAGSMGKAVHFDGTAWAPVAGLVLPSQLNGVHENAAGDVVMTGLDGAKFVGRPGAWRDDSSQPPSTNLHAVWFETIDDVFAAGGSTFTYTKGVVARLRP